MTSKEKAARDCHREAAHKNALKSPILADLGRCINCRQALRLVGGVTSCPTCAAWRRWAQAHRIGRLAAGGA